MSKHIISILVKNYSGVLTRVSGLFSRRGYNIESLSVGKTEDEKLSRITITLVGDDDITRQVIKQLEKLHDVKKITELDPEKSVFRELVLVKVHADPDKRSLINGIVDVFRCRVVDISKDTMTIELTGDESKVTALIDMMKEFGIKEMVRTGISALERGSKNIYIHDRDLEQVLL